jgi:hypothetical protein
MQPEMLKKSFARRDNTPHWIFNNLSGGKKKNEENNSN